MLALYAKALTHRPYRGKAENQSTLAKHDQFVLPKLPEIVLKQQVNIDANHCYQYNRLTQWQPNLAAVVHPNYIQTLSLAMQLRMMVDKNFPFSPMGMVHLANHIQVHKLPSQHIPLSLKTSFGQVYYHKKGWLFELLSSASSGLAENDSRPFIRATSFYLARTRHLTQPSEACPKPAKWLHALDDKSLGSQLTHENMRFSNDIGRKYARISGDYNPIHLHRLSARIFGFKKAIAHGMFSKAWVLSTLAKKHSFYKGEFEVDTLFKQPISLPSETELSSALINTHQLILSLHSPQSRKGRCFLKGEVRY